MLDSTPDVTAESQLENRAQAAARPQGEPVTLTCRDGVVLHGHLWPADRKDAEKRPLGSVIINPATGVLARYYHYYADYLARAGFDVLTYDYRGIGLSRPKSLKGSGYRWRDWGEQDFDAALHHMDQRRPGLPRSEAPIYVVGHSIGGYLPGLSPHAARIDRMLTVGAQYAWWGDYAAQRRIGLFWKWHVAMPALTMAYGYFPGRKLGWLEDLPAGVAREWSFRGPRMERTHPRPQRQEILDRFAAVTAPILAIVVADDELGTLAAVRRTLGYYRNAQRTEVLLEPSFYDMTEIGHFSLFHSRHAAGFWADSLQWLRDGADSWAPFG